MVAKPNAVNPRLFSREWRIARQHKFDFLIFFVTGQCNARCHHCFYWNNLGADHVGLSLEKIEKTARSMPPFRTLLLSGGEPTLRKDLPQLIDIFRRHNGIETVDIPTNGLLPDRIAGLAEEVLANNPSLHQVSFNLSIDGFADTHDQIRGVPGNFERSLATASQLRELKAEYPQLRVVVNSVICADNYQEIAEFAQHIHDQELFDNHFFEIIRGSPPEERIRDVPPHALKVIYDRILPIQESYLRRNKWAKYSFPMTLWRQVADMGRLIQQYRTQWQVHSADAKWSFPCQAGEAIAVIDYNGDVRVCELRDAAVNLSQHDYDFSRVLDTPIMLSERTAAKSHACDCTHVCFLTTSYHQALSARLWSAPWRYLRYRLSGKWD
jgi:MoaA/NifB/PqqE/SkfB family radical SAM enzyme